jgi:hypothetical protein
LRLSSQWDDRRALFVGVSLMTLPPPDAALARISWLERFS